MEGGGRVQAICVSVDITPELPVPLAGFSRARTATSVAERLEMNLIALREDPDCDPVILISCDLLYVGRWLRDLLQSRFAMIPPDRLLVAASHTHSAPMTDATKPLLGATDQRYLTKIAMACADLAREYASTDWTPVTLAGGSGLVAHSVNRRRRKRVVIGRRPGLGKVVNAPNPKGATDETVTKLVVRDRRGLVRGVVWNYACHPVAYADDHAVSAHFPAVVRDRLRQTSSNSELAVVFLQGFSGDTRPSASVASGRRMAVRRLIRGPTFCTMTPPEFHDWSSSLADAAVSVDVHDLPADGTELRTQRVLRGLEEFVADSPPAHVSFQAIRLGTEFCILGVGAEVVAEYGPMFRRRAGSALTMCVGCVDHTFGYLPTTTMLADGGYEAGGYCRTFGLGSLRHDVEQVFLRAIDDVLRPVD